MRYSYEYRDQDGHVHTGTVEATNEIAAQREAVEVLAMYHVTTQPHHVTVTVLADSGDIRRVLTCPHCGHNFAA